MAKKHSQIGSIEETLADTPRSVSEGSSPVPPADVSPTDNSASDSNPVTPKTIPEVDLNSVEQYLKGLTDEQKEKLGMRLRSSGVVKTASLADGITYPDGSMDIVVRLDPPVVEQLKIWSEGEGMSLGDQARLRINEAISSYIYGDWSGTQVKPEAPKPVATEPAAAGAVK